MNDPQNNGLAATMRGPVLTPGSPGYDEARKIWNGMFDRRPSLIARPVSAGDVIAAVAYARENNLEVAVRGGGHSFPGYSVCDGGLMIDLSLMKGIRVDPVTRRARAEPGLLWADFDRETQAFGLATTGGMISHTGIAGLTLGGGFGWLCRKHGLSIDNVLAFDLVTADGQLVQASADQNPELFWGLRGGGGNFGIVTSFDFQLHELGPVFGGLVAYPLPTAVQVLHDYNQLLKQAPDDVIVGAFMLTTPDGHQAVGLVPVYLGPDHEEGARLIEPFRKLGTPVMEQIGPMPYAVLQTMLDGAAAPHQRYYMRSNMVDELSDDLIRTLAEGYARTPSPLSAVVLFALGGATGRVGRDETAFFYRDASHSFTLLGAWTDPADDDKNIAWTREVFDSARPYLGKGVYVNELVDEGEDRVREAYGETYARLQALKRQYDPRNFFHLNQNIKP